MPTQKTHQDPVLLWSNKHQAWWKPDGMGYTTDLPQAGVYHRADAQERTPGKYDGRIVEPAEVADKLWRRRGEQAARAMIFTLGLLKVEQGQRVSRHMSHTILPIAPAIQPVLNPEQAQLVVDGLIALNTPEAQGLAEELVGMTIPIVKSIFGEQNLKSRKAL